MNIRMERIKGLSCPKITCDTCGQLIENARYGIVKWEPSSGQMIICHKGSCDRKTGGGHWYWQPLDVFLIYLCRNVAMDFKNAHARADSLGAIR